MIDMELWSHLERIELIKQRWKRSERTTKAPNGTLFVIS